MKDYQKQKVYDWENVVIPIVPCRHVTLSRAQVLIDGLWLAEGLLYPPAVVPLPKQTRKAWAKGCRTEIILPEEGVPEWVLIHELAHAMSGHEEGYLDWHGPIFVGNYIRLLEKYMRIPRLHLIASATAAGLDFDLNAKPVFIDKPKKET